jgi:Protein of unknown function DUF262
MIDVDLQKDEIQQFEAADAEQPIPPPDVVVYNEQRSCADLVRMHSTGKLEIQPDFQREVVWKDEDQARFIDSLLKQLPIPSMCFSLDYRTQKWKVIDGLQRMSSIIRFLSTSTWKMPEQSDIDPRLRGMSNLQLKEGTEEQRQLYSRIEEVSIPVTVIRCDTSMSQHMRYLFTIFYRLNSGGMRLTNQEIRNCIYSGQFNDMLKRFDRENKEWAKLKKRIWGETDRFRSVEILLRILAFSERMDTYDGNLAGFLNVYMHAKMTSSAETCNSESKRLRFAVESVLSALEGLPKGKRSLTSIEALLVGIINRGTPLDAGESKKRAQSLLSDEVFTNASKYAVGSEQNVKKRLKTAVNVFAHDAKTN